MVSVGDRPSRCLVLAELDTKAIIIKSVSDIPTEESRRETQENYRDFAKFAATEAFYQFATQTEFFFP